MKAKRALGYLGYTVIIFALIILTDKVLREITKDVTSNYNSGMRLMIIWILVPVLFGILLGIPNLLNESKKAGKWSIDIEKLLFISLPALFIACFNLMYFSGIQFLEVIMVFILKHLLILPGENLLLKASAILFGFSVITSLQKADQNSD